MPSADNFAIWSQGKFRYRTPLVLTNISRLFFFQTHGYRSVLELEIKIAVMKQIPLFVIVCFADVVRLYPPQEGYLVQFPGDISVTLISHAIIR